MTRREWAWASFDWANSAFPTVVTTFVVAAYFTTAVAPDPVTGQAWWGWTQSLAGLAIGLLSPVLGAMADAGGRRRLFLALFTGLTALATALIWFARPDPAWALFALLAVGAATVCFELGTVFYNSMLPEVTTRERIARVSGMAWGLGYAGGLACLVLCLVILVRPDPALFGLDRGAAEHVRAAALLVAAWVGVFALPLILLAPRERRAGDWRAGLRALGDVARRLPRRPALWRFLLARLFYTDGLNVLFAFGAVYAAGVFGMGFEEILLFGIALNVTAGIGAFAGGFAEERLGGRDTVLLSLGALMLIGLLMLLAQDKALFWALGVSLGLFFGPAQAASRSLMARMAPPGEMAAHFGLFALSGRITSFLGPALLAMVTAATGSQRWGLSVVLGLLGLGAAILLTIPREARPAG